MITIQILGDTPDEEIRDTRELIGNGDRSIYDIVKQLQTQVAEIESNMTSLGTDMAGTKEAVEALQEAVEEVEANLRDRGGSMALLNGEQAKELKAFFDARNIGGKKYDNNAG